MKMDMKKCFTGHSLAHNLLGVGLGLILVSLVPSLNNLLYGVVVVVVALAWDMLGK